ncbi:MAG TPA: thioesterase family protein [Acidimicrobiia bacterium]
MGDLAADTDVTGRDGRYRARLSRDWEIWGPCGVYVAAVLLRAAGAHAALPRPATLACHFLGVATFDDVELEVTTLRATRRTASVRASMRQGDVPVAEAIVWCVADDLEGPDLVRLTMPDVARPHESPLIQELAEDGQRRPVPFWDNFEYRPLNWLGAKAWEQRVDAPAEVRSWFRYVPTAVFDDPYVEAARVAMLVDISGWPALVRALSPSDEARWIAPNLDLAVSFHDAPAGAEHLLLDGYASIAAGGLAAGGGAVWSEDGRLLGSGTQQLIFRPVPEG